MIARTAGTEAEEEIVPRGVRAGGTAITGPRATRAGFRTAEDDAVLVSVEDVT